MGSYKRGYKSPNMGYKYSYLTYNPTHNYPGTRWFGCFGDESVLGVLGFRV